MRSHVLAAKARLAKGYDDFESRHRAGCPAVDLCTLYSNLRDAIVLDLVDAALEDLGKAGPRGLLAEIALVAHGGYGRRNVAPFSDVDMMILHRRGAETRLAPLAERLLRDVFDVGLVLGHSVGTVADACSLACHDTRICASLVDSRLVTGDPELFDTFMRRFRQKVYWRSGRLLAGIRRFRAEEHLRYGETVFMLEPNVKRSEGGLRDLQLLRWIGFARYRICEPELLHAHGLLSDEDLAALQQANEFLLGVRNELHFHAGQGNDVLDRFEQLRIAELRGYMPGTGLLPVERFMQDYFRHTGQVSHIVAQFVAKAASHERLGKLATILLGHRLEDDFLIGPIGVMATQRGLLSIRGDLTAILRMVDLANLHNAPIASSTWEEIRRAAPRLPDFVSPAACHHFLSLLAHPARLGPLLRRLHEAGILERFIPEFARARGLLQFNQYHKCTVDEDCIRAVAFAEDLLSDAGPVGRVYRAIANKHILHLALLLHDLGKGHLEDHCEVGLKIAEQAAERLGLHPHEGEILKFLVHKHLRMNHLAFRRDTSDEELVVRFAVQVGSPELLQMLYVLTACNLGAVGPGVWDSWKSELLTDLYHRAMQQLAGDSPATTVDRLVERRRAEIRAMLGPRGNDPWFARHIDGLPPGYLTATTVLQAAADLEMLHDLEPVGARVVAQYQPDSATVQCTIGTYEQVTPGIFHRLTGALSSLGLEIRAAQIHTLADGLVLDRFRVYDPDFAGEPPATRLGEIGRALEQSLRAADAHPPAFRRTWQIGGPQKLPAVRPQTRVNIDNSTSDRCTIVDVFAVDRTGLLYAITRTLFELELSVWRAKIDTIADQVVDVFYVTDRQDRKIHDEEQIEAIRRRLLEVVEQEPPT